MRGRCPRAPGIYRFTARMASPDRYNVTQMPSEWNIGYARWIIDDGEPEREVGERFRWFAIEFWATNSLTKSAAGLRSVSVGATYSYHVVAEVVHVSGNAAVIDFGLRAVGQTKLLPIGCKQGDYVTGEINLSFPLCTDILPDEIIASMTHDWAIKHIVADLTPYRPGDETNSWFVRDEKRVAYEEVNSTRERTAESYILQCALTD
jgi:hypothetical protein